MEGVLRFAGSTASWTVRAACLVHLVHEYVFECSSTRGESMLPTLQAQNDYIFATKHNRHGKDISIGDCIVAIKPSDPTHRVCKRITGMPGDLILIDPSSSSDLTNDPGEKLQHDGYNKYIRVPDGHVWVTGDNLSHSLDSRSYSVLPMALIKGKIVAAMSLDKGLIDDNGKLNWWNFRWIENSFVDE